MDCKEARPLLDANADHELPAPDARRVQQHIESCADCQRESEALRELAGVVRAATYHRAPGSLRERIIAGLPAVDVSADAPVAKTGEAPINRPAAAPGRATNTSSVPGRRWPLWLERLLGGSGSNAGSGSGSGSGSGGGRGRSGGPGGWGGMGGGALPAGGAGRLFAPASLAALVVVLCVAAGVTLSLRRPAPTGPFTDELVESHVRAQVSGRDIDVISTDRHTVKPWFNGKLDYSPPVEDLAANGFPLEGGRLDYLAHQRVAVLVYRYQKHVIDVYVYPQGEGTEASATATFGREGYSIAHWNAEGMTWWAISDAAPDALSGLEKALKARFRSGSERTETGS